MKTFFAILNDQISAAEVQKKAAQIEVKVIKVYPALRAVKFQSERDLDDLRRFSFFQSVEQEREDFTTTDEN